MSRSIGLMGMMGAGKSTVAGLVGDRLGRRVVDTDEEIARWRGASIPEIFAEEGEQAFRSYEQEVIEELARIDDLVISLGGGAVLADANVAAFLLTGVLLHLHVPAGELARRLEDTAGERPLLHNPDGGSGDGDGGLAARVGDLHERREPRYREVADGIIDADAPPEEVTDRIMDWLLENETVLTPSEYERLMR